MIQRRDIQFLAALALLQLLFLSQSLFTGETLFARDLIYLFHPRKAICSESILRGELPRWNPYTNGGQPLLANFQTAVLSPLSIFFYCFPFVWALKFFYLAGFTLLAVFGYLTGRKLEFSPWACFTGALLLSWNGIIVSKMEFLSHFGSYAWRPAIPLCFHRPKWLAIAGVFFFLGVRHHPTLPHDLYPRRGPWTVSLQKTRGNQRFMLSPLANTERRGYGENQEERWTDLRNRLFSLGSTPYHLRDLDGFSEPLLYAHYTRWIDRIFSAPSSAAAKPWIAQGGGAILALPHPHPSAETPWRIETIPHPRPLFTALQRQKTVPVQATQISPQHHPISVPAGSEAVIHLENWAPGWKAFDQLRHPLVVEPYDGTFQKIRCLPESREIDLRYDSAVQNWGIWITLFGLLACLSASFRDLRRSYS